MKSSLSVGIVSAALLITPFGVAQTPSQNEQERILALIKDVQIQHTQIADNQTKIEAKVADLAETIRVARLFAARIK
jgi:hypothetical protein